MIMKKRWKVLIVPFLIVFSICCNGKKENNNTLMLNADSLITNIDKYCDKQVEIEGVIVHICGAKQNKMKLRTTCGSIIKIVPNDPLDGSDKSFKKERVKVRGVVKESRIGLDEVEKMAEQKALLCHIDNTPCKDHAWVEGKINAGVADSLSGCDIAKLKRRMKHTKKDYVSVISILAEKIEIVGKVNR